MYNWQPTLEDDKIIARALQQSDFEQLFRVAADPAVWDQHPNKDRYKREVFENFFKGAIQSQGAYIIFEKESGEPIGSTRFYDWNSKEKSVLIGYTFFAKKFWGKGMNHRIKKLMLAYAFQYADTVIFHIGAVNQRSQRSIEKLGARKIGEMEVEYFGETPKLNFVYEITPHDLQMTVTSEPAR